MCKERRSRHRVWEALRRIPAGSTASYAEIAAAVGAPKLVRSVARACAANHLAVAIPCHRVVRTDGTLSGYRWGVERKQALLRQGSKVMSATQIGVVEEALKLDVQVSLPDTAWGRIERDLDGRGFAVIDKVLSPRDCRHISRLYTQDDLFRSRIVMARHGFGRGEYKYFCYPLPPLIADLRSAVYPALSRVANRWNENMGIGVCYPATHEAFLKRCHQAGQTRPTPLLLQYEAGDFNCLHQDIYGEHVFPLQMAILLSRPGEDFTGGEFVLTEQRPRMQSRASVVPLAQGDALILAVHHRPVQGARGFYRVNLRHGVSEVRSGRRHTLGVILHDAK
jgi:O-6-methylguanine DNA methyltransferase